MTRCPECEEDAVTHDAGPLPVCVRCDWNAPAVRFCVCGGVAGAPDHDHERRMAANYEASQIAIAESVHEQRVAEA